MGLQQTIKAAFSESLWELRERPRQFLGLCLLAGALLFSYGISRPTVESLFLETYGKDRLPHVWLAVAVAAALAVLVYNRFATRVQVTRLYLGAALVAATTLVLLLAGRGIIPHATFLLYVWKDVHIVVLVEIFWSFANLLYPVRSARWAYGLFCAAGSLGAMSAESTVGLLASAWGTQATLWAVAPLLVVGGLGCTLLGTDTNQRLQSNSGRGSVTEKMTAGLRTVSNSRYLVPLLALIGIIQITITLIDYQFNGAIAAAYPATDARTGVIGKVYAAISFGSLLLQLGTGPVLKFAGVPFVLLGIPAVLGGAVGLFALSPRFLTMAVAKVCSKAFDYSLFRAAKEILYIPLSYSEKTQGKAFVDMLTYRVAKGGASLLLLWLSAAQVGATGMSVVNLALIGAWLVLAFVIARRYLRLRHEQADTATAASPGVEPTPQSSGA